MGTGANATGVQTHHLLGNVQDATKHAKEARDKGNVAASDLCALCNLRETRGHCWPKTISLESSETESTISSGVEDDEVAVTMRTLQGHTGC